MIIGMNSMASLALLFSSCLASLLVLTHAASAQDNPQVSPVSQSDAIDSITYDDSTGVAGATRAPVSVALTLPESLTEAAAQDRLILSEECSNADVFAQYEDGRLWWLMPEGKPGKRVFKLGASETGRSTMAFTKNDGRYLCMDGTNPVLGYNFKTVPVPPGSKGKYAIARSNYVHPIYGPSGEVLTADFQKDYPHHRGLYWAWPEVMWQGEKRDLHALQGVFARPVKIVRKEDGPVFASLEAENVWKWGDRDEIVREWTTIRAFRSAGGDRVLDFTLRFEAIQPGVTIARRNTNVYGGFNLRMSPRADQAIRITPDPSKAWAELVGIPRDGQSPVGITILQHPENPGFPGDWQQFPKINWLQPTFPAKNERFELKVDDPLVLRYRLIVHPGSYDNARSFSLWQAFQKEY